MTENASSARSIVWRLTIAGLVAIGVLATSSSPAGACSCGPRTDEARLLGSDVAVVARTGGTDRGDDGVETANAVVLHVVFDRTGTAASPGDVVVVDLGETDSCQGRLAPDRLVVLTRDDSAPGVFDGRQCVSGVIDAGLVEDLIRRVDGAAVTPPVAVAAHGGSLSLIDEGGTVLRSDPVRPGDTVTRLWGCSDEVFAAWESGAVTNGRSTWSPAEAGAVDVRCGQIRVADGSWAVPRASDPTIPPGVGPERHDGSFWLDGAGRLHGPEVPPVELSVSAFGLIDAYGAPVVFVPGAVDAPRIVPEPRDVPGVFWQIRFIEIPTTAMLDPPIAGGETSAAVIRDRQTVWTVRERDFEVEVAVWLGAGRPLDVTNDELALAAVDGGRLLVERATGEVVTSFRGVDHVALLRVERRPPIVLEPFSLDALELVGDVPPAPATPSEGPLPAGWLLLLLIGAGLFVTVAGVAALRWWARQECGTRRSGRR